MNQPSFFTKQTEKSETYGKFEIEPLPFSFGQSMGNALRRTLLSSLKGAAISAVKIEDAPHLFATLKGVKESVLEFVLNLKQLRFEMPGDGPYHVHLSLKKPGKVYGKDVSGEVSVVNGDLYLAEITDTKGSIELDAIIETGYGFLAAEEKDQIEAGYIPVDSSFSPVLKVNFKVEEVRVGAKSNNERLLLEVWTDGSIAPEQALLQAKDILSAQFNYILSENASKQKATEATEAKERATEKNSKLDDIIIDELNLPSRVINALLRENIETVSDLIATGRKKLIALKGVGRKSIDLIEDELKKMDITIE